MYQEQKCLMWLRFEGYFFEASVSKVNEFVMYIYIYIIKNWQTWADWRSISQNIAPGKYVVHDVINVLC